jgi:hypothetical protein
MPSSAGQPQVRQHDIGLLPLQHIHRAADVFRDVGVVIVVKQPPQPFAGMLLVIDDQNGRLHGENVRRGCGIE